MTAKLLEMFPHKRVNYVVKSNDHSIETSRNYETATLLCCLLKLTTKQCNTLIDNLDNFSTDKFNMLAALYDIDTIAIDAIVEAINDFTDFALFD